MDRFKEIANPNISPGTLTPDHVRGLSLHEVTKEFGTLGLYTRLEDSLHQYDLDTDSRLLWAVQFGLMLHANQERSNGHYADHLMRVTLRVIEHFGITDPTIVKAAILHDSVEDHPEDIVRILRGNLSASNIQEEALRCYEAKLGKGATDIIRQVTNPVFNPDKKIEEYEAHTLAIVLNYPKARVVKLADFIDNAVGNHFSSPSRRQGLDEKYLPSYRLHKMGLFMPDSLITGEERERVLAQLTRGHFRALARLAIAS